MKDIRTAAKTHPTLRDEFRDSTQPSIILLSSLFQRLKLKDEPFTLFSIFKCFRNRAALNQIFNMPIVQRLLNLLIFQI